MYKIVLLTEVIDITYFYEDNIKNTAHRKHGVRFLLSYCQTKS